MSRPYARLSVETLHTLRERALSALNKAEQMLWTIDIELDLRDQTNRYARAAALDANDPTDSTDREVLL